MLLLPDALGVGAGPEHLIVGLYEAKSLPVLDHPQAVEAPALGLLEIFVAEKIVGSVGGYDDRLGAVRHPALVILEILQAEQIPADGAWREQPGHELDIEIVGLAERHVESDIGRARFGERRHNLARGHPPARHCALGEELVPGHEIEALDIEGRNSHGGPRVARAQHQPRGGEDGGAHGARTDRRTGDEIRRQ
jgi:hypothetical protein